MLVFFRKNLRWVTTIIIFIVPLILVYIFVFHPIVGTPFMKFEQYHGVEYYTTGEYLEFEKGSLFQEKLSSYEFLEGCWVTDFYYSDNRFKDSIVYGKRPDVYGVLLDTGEDYEKIKAEIVAAGLRDSVLSSGKPDKTLDVYLMPQHNDENVELVFIVGRDIEYLSFIMVSEISKEDQARTYTAIIDVIHFWSTLPFAPDEK